MNAKEARALYLTNAMTTKQVLEQIEYNAKGGAPYLIGMKLHHEVINDLVEKGFKVSNVTDNFGVDSTKIEW